MFGWLKGWSFLSWSFLGKRGRDAALQIASDDEPLRKKVEQEAEQEANQEASLSLDDLPNELLVEIASHLDTPKDVVSLGSVNQSFYELLINQKEGGVPIKFHFRTLEENRTLSLEEAKISLKIKAQQEELKLVEESVAFTAFCCIN